MEGYFYIASMSGQVYLVKEWPRFTAGYWLASEQEVAEYEKKFGKIPPSDF